MISEIESAFASVPERAADMTLPQTEEMGTEEKERALLSSKLQQICNYMCAKINKSLELNMNGLSGDTTNEIANKFVDRGFTVHLHRGILTVTP